MLVFEALKLEYSEGERFFRMLVSSSWSSSLSEDTLSGFSCYYMTNEDIWRIDFFKEIKLGWYIYLVSVFWNYLFG